MADFINQREYLTQGEVAERFRICAGTVKNWRERGCFPYLKPTGSTRVLYPIEGIDDFEKQLRKQAKGVVKRPKKPGIKRKKPVIPNTQKKWEI